MKYKVIDVKPPILMTSENFPCLNSAAKYVARVRNLPSLAYLDHIVSYRVNSNNIQELIELVHLLS